MIRKFAAATALTTALAVAGSAGAVELFSTGEASSTAHAASSTQHLGARLVFSNAVIIDQFEGFLRRAPGGDPDGELVFNVYSEQAGLPDDLQFSFVLEAAEAGDTYGWYGATGVSWALGAGAYWFTLEQSNGAAALVGALPPNPAARYIANSASNPGDFEGWFATKAAFAFAFRVGGEGGGDVSIGDPWPPRTPGVPEPSSWAMMILGFGAAGAALRRRRTAYA